METAGQRTATPTQMPNIGIETSPTKPTWGGKQQQQGKEPTSAEGGETVKMPIMWLLSQEYEDGKMM